MTTPSTPRKAGPLLGNGSTTAFPFTFKVFAASDVAVTIADSAEVETALVLGADYSVTLNANQETSPGGTVTYPISGSPLATGHRLSIVGALGYDQPLDLPSGGNFSPVALENQLDRATMQIQQLKEQVDRSAKLPVTYDLADLADFTANIIRLGDSADEIDILAGNMAAINTVASDLSEPVSEINTVAAGMTNVNAVGENIANVNAVAGVVSSIPAVAAAVPALDNFVDTYYGPSASNPATRRDGTALQPGDLYYNVSTQRMRVFDGAAWVEALVNAGTISVQSFSGTGAQTAFALSTAPTSANNVQVFISGVYQAKSEYSVSGTALTFTSAPPAGTNNIEVVTIATLAVGVTDAAMVGKSGGGTLQDFLDGLPLPSAATGIGIDDGLDGAWFPSLSGLVADYVASNRPSKKPNGPIEIIAHRGFKSQAPQNTMLAFSMAVSRGADALETDLQMSSDGVIYCFHDTTVDALTNGTGTFTSLSSATVNSLTFDSTVGTVFADESIPTLEQMLRLARDHGVKIYPEIKGVWTEAQMSSLLTLLDAYGYNNDRCVIQAGFIVYCQQLRALSPNVGVSYVGAGTLAASTGFIETLKTIRGQLAWSQTDLIAEPAFVPYCYNRGVDVIGWVAASSDQVRRLTEIGVRKVMAEGSFWSIK
jgi:glycerophosphoryl diester phosphodiesterase